MGKILQEKEIEVESKKIRKEKGKIVLAGGCFDLLHIGHIEFLKNAKKHGTLFILLESDESIKRLKGIKKPIIPIAERAEILASINYVDYVVPLSGIKTNEDYKRIISQIRPDFVAVTNDDASKEIKKQEVEEVGGKIIEVTHRIKDRSSSRYCKLFNLI
jgi:rfaE bifunctional protein nucleotidyltransferase chain/domain